MLIESCKRFMMMEEEVVIIRVLLFSQINTLIGMTSFLYSTFRSVAHTISNIGKKNNCSFLTHMASQLGGGSPKIGFLKKGLNGGTTITDCFRLEDHYGTEEDM